MTIDLTVGGLIAAGSYVVGGIPGGGGPAQWSGVAMNWSGTSMDWTAAMLLTMPPPPVLEEQMAWPPPGDAVAPMVAAAEAGATGKAVNVRRFLRL